LNHLTVSRHTTIKNVRAQCEAPDTSDENFTPSDTQHVCIHCKLDPPDGTERMIADDTWAHPRCEAAFIRARMAEEGLAQEGTVSPQKTNGGGQYQTEAASERPTYNKATATDFLADLVLDKTNTTPVLAAPELTLFVNARGALTKQFMLAANGDLVKTEGGQMAAGTAKRIAIDNRKHSLN